MGYLDEQILYTLCSGKYCGEKLHTWSCCCVMECVSGRVELNRTESTMKVFMTVSSYLRKDTWPHKIYAYSVIGHGLGFLNVRKCATHHSKYLDGYHDILRSHVLPSSNVPTNVIHMTFDLLLLLPKFRIFHAKHTVLDGCIHLSRSCWNGWRLERKFNLFVKRLWNN